MTPAILDHLWQSTVLALALGLLTLAFRRSSAAVRHGLWVAASIKFLIPFAALAALGGLIAPAIHLPEPPAPEAAFIERAAQPFSEAAPLPAQLSQVPIVQAPAPFAPRLDPALILLALWALGFAAVTIPWAGRWIRLRRVVRSAQPLPWPAPMPVLAASSLVEPGLVGLWRPVLLVPETLPQHLSQVELAAVVAHEACHLRRKDNVTAALHMLVEALFWFHPLTWWIGARMIEERERACDEAVVRAGHDRAVYARSLVESCRLYLQSPLDCVAGASGSNLKTRVEAIMTAPLASPLSLTRKLLLGSAGALACASPVAAGMIASPAGQQTVAYAVASPPARALARVADAVVKARSVRAVIASDQAQADAPVAPEQQDAAPAPAFAVAAADAQTEPAPVAVEQVQPDAAPPAAPPLWTPVVAAAQPADARQAARSLVQSYGEAFWNTDRRLCIRVEGGEAKAAAAIQARVESDARAANISVERTACGLSYQIEIRVAADADRAVGEVLDYYHHPVWPFPMERPAGADRPIKAWYGLVYDHAGAARWEGGGPAATGLAADPNAHQKFALAIVVIDPRRTAGMSPDAVADYVAMLALAQPRALDRCNVLPSVTDLFAGACPGRAQPAGLTPADAAYLKALYTGSPEIRASRYPSELIDRLARLLGDARVASR